MRVNIRQGQVESGGPLQIKYRDKYFSSSLFTLVYEVLGTVMWGSAEHWITGSGHSLIFASQPKGHGIREYAKLRR